MLRGKTTRQRPLSYHILHYYTFINHRQGRITSVQIDKSSALVPPTGNPKRSLGDQDLSFRTMNNIESPGRAGSIDQRPSHTLDKAFFLLDRDGPPPSPTSWEESALVELIPDAESLPYSCYQARLVVAEEVAREHANQLTQPTQQAV